MSFLYGLSNYAENRQQITSFIQTAGHQCAQHLTRQRIPPLSVSTWETWPQPSSAGGRPFSLLDADGRLSFLVQIASTIRYGLAI